MDKYEETITRLVNKMDGGLISESYDDILKDVEQNEAKHLMETASIIREASVNFITTQAVVLKNLPSNSTVDGWGKANVPGWDKMPLGTKVNEIVKSIGNSGLHAARVHTTSKYGITGSNFFDMDDVDDPVDSSQIRDSKLGRELTELFIKLLLAGRSDF